MLYSESIDRVVGKALLDSEFEPNCLQTQPARPRASGRASGESGRTHQERRSEGPGPTGDGIPEGGWPWRNGCEVLVGMSGL